MLWPSLLAAGRFMTAANPSPSRWRGWLFGVLSLLMLAAATHWAWRQPFATQLRMSWQLSRMPAPTSLPMPVDGVRARQIADTFGAPRGSDRRHAGVDIFAPAGTPVRSTTTGIVVAVLDRGLGGRQVWVLGPARERHYYAHLSQWTPGLAPGDIVAPGSLIGLVGNTGNARTTPPHLHYAILRPRRGPRPVAAAARNAVNGTRRLEHSVMGVRLVRHGRRAYLGLAPTSSPGFPPPCPSNATASPSRP